MNHTKPLPPVTHDEARACLSRFNQSHWWPKKVTENGERARYSIPCDEARDDDCIMDRYIQQQRIATQRAAELLEAATILARWRASSLDDMMPGYVCENPIASAMVRAVRESA